VARASIFLAFSFLLFACGDDSNTASGGSGSLPPPGCGNGVVEQGEFCDAGGMNNDFVPNACRLDCMPAFCGDNVRDDGEECDRGDQNGGAECSEACISLVEETSSSSSSSSESSGSETDTDVSTTAVEDTSSSSGSSTAEDTTMGDTTAMTNMSGMMEGGGAD
jgi:hypothetical protein